MRYEIERHRKKKKIVCVSKRDILICHISIWKPWGYEEVKNPEEKPNMGAVEAKRLYLERGGRAGRLMTYSWIRTEIK